LAPVLPTLRWRYCRRQELANARESRFIQKIQAAEIDRKYQASPEKHQ